MGDPKFSRRKYVTPSHPWQGERIIREKELTRKYGLKNKTELWKIESLLRIFRKRARHLQAQIRYENMQAEKEMDELLKKLNKLGLLGDESTLDDVLVLETENLLSRRLQTMTYLKGLSYSHKHARQLIVHGHIAIGGKKVTVPGYLVKRTEEEVIDYIPNSPLANDLHPARPRDEIEEGADAVLGAEPEAAPAAAEVKEDKPAGKDEKPEKAEGSEKPPEDKTVKPDKPKEEKPEEKKEGGKDTPEKPPAEEKKDEPADDKKEKPAEKPEAKKEGGE